MLLKALLKREFKPSDLVFVKDDEPVALITSNSIGYTVIAADGMRGGFKTPTEAQRFVRRTFECEARGEYGYFDYAETYAELLIAFM